MHDDSLMLEQVCAARSERVWDVLIRPELWWGSDIVLEACVGGRFHEPWHDSEGQHHTRGRVIEIDAPRLLKLSWKDDDWSFETMVAIRLAAQGERCRIVLTHSGWNSTAAGDRERLRTAHLRGWTHHLANLAAGVEKAALNDVSRK
ncbi:SRPBCC domain-containing protein [Roseibium sp. MMSF_3544]|uniref:SRPBCC family protein n=1 Tax=unclassified Roseibium TaxID=2629323 RepID=UPI00273D533F|nr:SRPBCC domain-containing protein [Roseibium sp. MMSF_3544]